MDLLTLSFVEFMGGYVAPTADTPEELVPALILTLKPESPWLEPIELMPDATFATAVANRIGPSSAAHQVLLNRDDGGWRIVGAYIDDTLAIEQGYLGRGLSTELILRCVAHRPVPQKLRQVTTRGYRALLRAYLTGVERAARQG